MAALATPDVVTTTLAVPAAPAGVVQLMEVPPLSLGVAQLAPPMVTVELVVKPEPAMVTAVPPRVEPDEGVMEVTVGGVT